MKKLRAGDIRRLKEKLIESEKLADKDDTSSTTTETSSIEADDKVWWAFFVINSREKSVGLIIVLLAFLAGNVFQSVVYNCAVVLV